MAALSPGESSAIYFPENFFASYNPSIVSPILLWVASELLFSGEKLLKMMEI